MNLMRNITLALTLTLASFLLLADSAIGESPATAPPAATSTAPADTSNAIPRAKLEELQKCFAKPSATSQAEFEQKTKAQFTKALELGQQLEKDYPSAMEIYQVRMIMLRAAYILNQIEQDDNPKTAARLTEIAKKISKSDAVIDQKVVADFLLTDLATKKKPQPEQKKIIQAYINKYAKTSAAPKAYVFAIQIAMADGQNDLVQTLADKLAEKYPNDLQAKSFLQNALGRGEFYAKPFTAELTKLDGQKLKLPDDMKGKVVVIDFWAEWCGPCRASMPHLKEIYEKFKPQGVEVVGINLDDNREVVEKFIKEAGLNWIITFEGKGQADPTARKYKIAGIPSIWVVGKDGKVVSTNARADLEGTIQRALKAK